jgi:hypothetical protein
MNLAVPGPHVRDSTALHRELGVSIGLATEAEVAPRFPDCELGAMSPLARRLD